MDKVQEPNSDPATSTLELVIPPAEEFSALDAEIDGGIRALEENSFALGRLLRKMRETKLYRVRHRRWQDYLDEKAEIGRQHAWRLIRAAETLEVIEEKMSPRGDILLPSNEAQIRELLRLKDVGDLVRAWEDAVGSSPGGSPTVAEVAAAVRELLPPPGDGEPETPDGDGGDGEAAADAVPITRRDIPGWESVKLADGSGRAGALCPSGCIPARVAREKLGQMAEVFGRMKLEPGQQVALQEIAVGIFAAINLCVSGKGGGAMVKGFKYLLRDALAEIPLKSAPGG